MSRLIFADCELPLSEAPAGRWDVVIEHGRIASVGAAGSADAVDGTRIEARGRALLPCFIDAHVHIPESGVEMLRCDMSACRSRDEVLARVAAYGAENPEEEWIVGRGWDSSHFLAEPPTLAEIDAITGDRPAYLNNRDGHSVWVNSAALARAGVDASSPDPVGGVIDRDATGALTGLLYESAMQLVSDIIPSVTREQLLRGLVVAQDYMFSLGVTGWQDAIVGDFVPTTDVFELYRDTASDGTLKARVTGSLWWDREAAQRDLDELVALRDSLPADGRFRCTSVKVMYDGWFSTHSAAISRDYVRGRDGNRGVTFFSPEEVLGDVARIDAAGFDLHFHSVGDRATSEILAALDHAIRTNAPRDRRHQIAHLWVLGDEQIAEMARLRLLANLQPFWARHHAELDEIVSPALPDELRTRQLRFASLSRAGIPLASGSDWPVSSANPFDAIHVAVNRAHPVDGDLGVFHPEERLTVTEALRAATSGSAHAIRRDDEVGSIEVGKLADVVLLSHGIEGYPAGELFRLRADYTVVGGEVVYTRD
jgi:predicted amidohydrolase YtcJ